MKMEKEKLNRPLREHLAFLEKLIADGKAENKAKERETKNRKENKDG